MNDSAVTVEDVFAIRGRGTVLAVRPRVRVNPGMTASHADGRTWQIRATEVLGQRQFWRPGDPIGMLIRSDRGDAPNVGETITIEVTP